MTEITDVNKIKLNILTQDQYDGMDKEPTEFYLVTDGKVNFNDLDNIPDFSDYQTKSNLVTSLTENSKDTEYPSAKCMWDLIKSLQERISELESHI